MSAFGDDLRRYLAGQPIRARAPGAAARAVKWARRHPVGSAAGTVTLVALLVVSSLLTAYVRAARALTRTNGELLVQSQLADSRARESLEYAAAARRESQRVLQLADLKRLRELEIEASQLWPPYPDAISGLEDWQRRARLLIDRLDEHRSSLAALEASEAHQGTLDPSLPLLPFPNAGATNLAPSDGAELRWQQEALLELLAGAERLRDGLMAEGAVSGDFGWSIPRRLDFARGLRDGFAPEGEQVRAWEEALSGIHASYPGLDLPPQMGLVPIGQDPESGLWEFAHLASGTPAERDADGRLIVAEDTGIVLVLLPGGSFWMGAQRTDPSGRNYDPMANADEGPVHVRELSPFFLSKFEMTQYQWCRITGDNPSRYDPHNWNADWLESGSPATLRHPVEGISWNDCTLWLTRVGLQLPSETQWEYAARAGTETAWWVGADAEELTGVVNIVDRYALEHGAERWVNHELWLIDGATTHAPVGSYAPNPFGLHDVHGNVWEWCADNWYEFSSLPAPTQDVAVHTVQSGPRIYRGGAFSTPASFCRASHRGRDDPSEAVAFIGVRPACTVQR